MGSKTAESAANAHISELLKDPLGYEIKGTYKDDFWEMNPDFELVSAFTQTRKVSSGRNVQSRLMWYIVYAHKDSFAITSLPVHERQQTLLNILNLPETHISKPEMKRAIKKYKELKLSRPQRYLRAVEDQMDTATLLIEDHKLKGFKDIAQLNQAMKEFGQLKERHEEAMAEYVRDRTSRDLRTKQGRQLSAADRGDLFHSY